MPGPEYDAQVCCVPGEKHLHTLYDLAVSVQSSAKGKSKRRDAEETRNREDVVDARIFRVDGWGRGSGRAGWELRSGGETDVHVALGPAAHIHVAVAAVAHIAVVHVAVIHVSVVHGSGGVGGGRKELCYRG